MSDLDFSPPADLNARPGYHPHIEFDDSDYEPTPVPSDADYELKSWTYLFAELIAGRKTADMRDKRDRPYAVGQRPILREFDHTKGTYTGRWAICEITHIISNDTPCAMSSAALDRNFAILSLRVLVVGEDA